MRLTKLPIEVSTALYLIAYVPYIIIARALATTIQPGMGRRLTGLETLPAVMIIGGMFIFLFAWGVGWLKPAHHVRLGPLSFPWPRWSTTLSGIGTAMLLFTVPLSLTFQNVSVPFMQLIMRGDVLIVAPLVDLVFGRRVRWWSWVALALVAVALWLTIGARGGLNLPPLAILTVIVYTLGYFVRLAVMTRIAKSGRENELEAYFVEEKMVAMPLSVAMLAALMLLPVGQGADTHWGFIGVWTSSALPMIAALSVAFFGVTVFSTLILLDRRENTFCVPFERAASIIAGIIASYLLAVLYRQKYPTPAELMGTGLLVFAVTLLSLAPRFAGSGKAATVPA